MTIRGPRRGRRGARGRSPRRSDETASTKAINPRRRRTARGRAGRGSSSTSSSCSAAICIPSAFGCRSYGRKGLSSGAQRCAVGGLEIDERHPGRRPDLAQPLAPHQLRIVALDVVLHREGDQHDGDSARTRRARDFEQALAGGAPERLEEGLIALEQRLLHERVVVAPRLERVEQELASDHHLIEQHALAQAVANPGGERVRLLGGVQLCAGLDPGSGRQVRQRLLVVDQIVPVEADGDQIGLEVEPLREQVDQLLARVVAADPRVDHLEAPLRVARREQPLELLCVEIVEADPECEGERIAQAQDADLARRLGERELVVAQPVRIHPHRRVDRERGRARRQHPAQERAAQMAGLRLAPGRRHVPDQARDRLEQERHRHQRCAEEREVAEHPARPSEGGVYRGARAAALYPIGPRADRLSPRCCANCSLPSAI